MKNNLEYRGVIRLCLLYICFLVPPPYFAHFPHGHCFKTSPNLLLPQQQQISGTVTDNYGPMSGVHVLIKGTNTGTFTNPQGEYFLLVNNNDILVFSYLGYHSRELPVLGRTTMEVEMKSEVTELQEVEVNAGYYTVKERERTGSIARVTAKEIELQPIVSPLEALQGRMAGVEVVQPNGVPGSAPRVRIRGQNSLRNGSEDNGNLPLYIVDGVPINAAPIHSYSGLTNSTGLDPLNTLNLANIESIEVLKDADATAIYGSRGANGVILISTKTGRGSEGKTQVDVRLYSGLSRASNRLDLLDTEQYLSLRMEAFENDNVAPTTFNAVDLVVWDQDRYTDWQKELYGGTATVTDLNIGVSGGNKNTSFGFGGSYHTEGTVFPGGSKYNKVTANFNLDHYSRDARFRLNLTVNYGLDDNRLFNGSSFVAQALSLPPNAPALFNDDGSLNWEGSTWTNPLGILKMDSRAQANNLISNVGMSYKIGKAITLRTNMGYTFLDSGEKLRRPISAYDPANWDRATHSSLHSLTNRKSWIIEPQIIYHGSNQLGNLDALLGTTFQPNNDNIIRMTGTGYSNEHLIGNLAAADAVTVGTNENALYRYNAIFGRIGYNWKRKYFINLTGRRDGSSRFGKDKRFANFGAIGAAWIFSKNNQLDKDRSFLSFGKFRASYGLTGSDQIGNYRYLDAYEVTPGPGGLYPTQLTNPDYSWESNKKLEAAVELGFFKDMINFGVSWYRNRSSNQLVGYQLPSITGFTTVQANLPATVQNKGLEIEASTLNFNTKYFRWRTSFNISYPNNELVDYPDLEQSSYANLYRIGHPLNIALLYNYDGIDPETGLYRVVDVNEDGRLDYADRTIILDQNRKYFGGVQNEFNYKGLSLNFLLEFVNQDGIRQPSTPPGRNNNIPQGLNNVWRAERQQTNVQIASQAFPAYIAYLNMQNSDFNYVDASFIRLKTLSMGYALPSSILQGAHVSACQIYVHAQNLFTITGYKGLDPQRPGSTQLPALRSITLGVQLQF